MKGNSNWDLDLAYGQLHEELVKRIFTGAVKIEVKTDRLAAKTGNLAVEIESRGKPSGLSTTKAEYWVYVLPPNNILVAFPTEYLRKLQQEAPRIRGGDRNSSVLCLIPLRKALDHSILAKNLKSLESDKE